MDGWDSYKSEYSGTARDLAEFIKYEFSQADLEVSTIYAFASMCWIFYEMMSNQETIGEFYCNIYQRTHKISKSNECPFLWMAFTG
jgi:hypothetical protein